MKTNRKTPTTISLNAKILDAARKKAASEKRTLSAQIEIWMEERLGKSAAR